jgi:hypothetical protein
MGVSESDFPNKIGDLSEQEALGMTKEHPWEHCEVIFKLEVGKVITSMSPATRFMCLGMITISYSASQLQSTSQALKQPI